jgi:hypothetical protein
MFGAGNKMNISLLEGLELNFENVVNAIVDETTVLHRENSWTLSVIKDEASKIFFFRRTYSNTIMNAVGVGWKNSLKEFNSINGKLDTISSILAIEKAFQEKSAQVQDGFITHLNQFN